MTCGYCGEDVPNLTAHWASRWPAKIDDPHPTFVIGDARTGIKAMGEDYFAHAAPREVEPKPKAPPTKKAAPAPKAPAATKTARKRKSRAKPPQDSPPNAAEAWAD